MSQHGCPERLSNRSKAFQEDAGSQPTMELLVETLTGTAFEMTVSPSDTVLAIKSKIFRVEGIPVSQQHLLYNLRELEDSAALRELGVTDGARLRLVLGMRGGPISTRRLPPPAPPMEPWPDIERLLDSNRDDVEWSSNCKVTVLVFRDGHRVNMLRVKDNHDGTYSPIDNNKYSARLSHVAEGPDPAPALQENAVTMGKMLDLRRRMEALSLQRSDPRPGEKVEIQKTRSEETLSGPRLLEEGAEYARPYAAAPYSEAEDSFTPLYDRDYSRYDVECCLNTRYRLLPPLGARADAARPDDRALHRQTRREADSAILEECLAAEECLRRPPPPLAADYGPLVGGAGGGGGPGAWRGGAHAHSASALAAGARAVRPPLSDALFSSSTSDLDTLKQNSRILPALSRHRPREHLHLSDEGLHLPRSRARAALLHDAALAADRDDTVTSETPVVPPPAPPASHDAGDAKEKKIRIRCGFCKKRLSIATVHRCRCGAAFCAPHRYAEVHGCAYDYKAALLPPARPRRTLPRI